MNAIDVHSVAVKRSQSMKDLQLENDSKGKYKTKLCDKICYFDFPIVHFPLISINDSAAHVYRVIYLSTDKVPHHSVLPVIMFWVAA